LSASQTDGMVSRDSLGIDIKFEEDSIKNYKIVREGDYVIHLRSFQGGFAFSDRVGVCSPAYTILRPTQQISYGFLKPFFMSNKFIDSLRLVTYGIRDGKSISVEEWLKLSTSLPSVEEQKKISAFLSLLDERIATQIKIIEDLKKLKSAIRAKLFSQIETSCESNIQIRDMLNYEQPSEYIVQSTEYSDEYETPVLTANKAFILGYTDEKFGIYDKGECIILDDFTMDVKYVSFPFKVKSSAIKILTPKPGVDLYFLYEYIQCMCLVAEEHKRHYISEIEPMVVACPTFEEQQNISNLLRSFDSKIECANRELILYNKQKQHLLSQMFI
jgi:type I restriction enzyme S subunit